jgi:protein-disulfide isomerase
MFVSFHRPGALAVLATAVFAACSPGTRGSSNTPADSASSASTDSVRSLTDSVLRIADAARITGDSAAPVWFVIMSDFQCPFCRRFFNETYPRIKREYVDRGRVRMAFINFPSLDHVHAPAAAERALCAGLQQKFWEYHDELFRTFDRWVELRQAGALQHFDVITAQLGLDWDDMQLCQSSGILRQLIGSDVRRSQSVGADATPSFLIGSKLVKGALPFDSLRKHLDSAIAAARRPGS